MSIRKSLKTMFQWSKKVLNINIKRVNRRLKTDETIDKWNELKKTAINENNLSISIPIEPPTKILIRQLLASIKLKVKDKTHSI